MIAQSAKALSESQGERSGGEISGRLEARQGSEKATKTILTKEDVTRGRGSLFRHYQTGGRVTISRTWKWNGRGGPTEGKDGQHLQSGETFGIGTKSGVKRVSNQEGTLG